ncbi:MAG: D-xylose ABC transporter ATP-binding protein [Chloroflexi bacterium RBG_16_52_11]|nr:MAG: D-xylose ABC transporter ATP-binding protein [Chloroflexi bacterium RBG_16_52_11]
MTKVETTTPVLQVKHISKRFDTTQALDDISLDLYPGEIHALMGENGAGKSTLIKIMTGVYHPDEGELWLDGNPIRVAHSVDAQGYGIAAIYQEPMVYPDLNVAENIFITHRRHGFFVNWGKMYRDAEEILARLDVKLDVRMAARGLTLAAQQTIEIAKAISLHVRVLIMDEPTASLSAHEVEQLFNITRALRDQGVSILFISHRMEEVFDIADRVTIFRDGRWISTLPRSEITPERAIHDMVGRNLEEFFAKSERQRGELLMSVSGLSKENVFSGMNFDVYRGEILGFAGLVGSRRTDVGMALFGVEPADTGDITLDGKTEKIRSPEQAMHLGIAYMTEDRRLIGLTMPMSITSNISLPMLHQYLSRLGLIQSSAEEATAEQYRERLTIRTPNIQQPVGMLSGGNQQKVMLSKWLNTRPQLLILDEPTRGIDVGAKVDVHHIINGLAAQGLGIILISSDLPEIMAMSDRILVMREGRQMGIFNRDEATQEIVLTAAMGQNGGATENA